MKIRQGFVSNSSSSSFICEICGREETGYDLSCSEAYMIECENGHVFCEEHLEKSFDDIVKEIKETKPITDYLINDIAYDLAKKNIEGYDSMEWSNKREERDRFVKKLESMTEEELRSEFSQEIDEFWDSKEEYEFRGEYFPAKYCPICSFKYIMPDDKVTYIAHQYKITHEEVFNYMKEISKRLSKVRPQYWLELLEKKHGVTKEELDKEIHSKYSSLEEFYQGMK